MSMQDVMDSFWDDRLRTPENERFGFLLGKRIPVFCARTKDGKARIVRVIPYTGLYRNMFDCVVTLECFGMNGNVKTVEMSYNSKDYRE